MAMFRKKPVVIEAIQWQATRESWDKIVEFMGREPYPGPMGSKSFIIKTLEGEHSASNGDWIIKGVKGEFYPCKPGIFALTYEETT